LASRKASSRNPLLKQSWPSVEDDIIALFPDQPCPKHEDIHEEVACKLLLGMLHHLVER
jgi:hypothetical protein